MTTKKRMKRSGWIFATASGTVSCQASMPGGSPSRFRDDAGTRMAPANPNRRLRVPGADDAAARVFLCCQVGRFGFAPDSPQWDQWRRLPTRKISKRIRIRQP